MSGRRCGAFESFVEGFGDKVKKASGAADRRGESEEDEVVIERERSSFGGRPTEDKTANHRRHDARQEGAAGRHAVDRP